MIRTYMHRGSANSWPLQPKNLNCSVIFSPTESLNKFLNKAALGWGNLYLQKYGIALLTLAFLICLQSSTTHALSDSSIGQSDFESRLTEAVTAQSAGDFKAAIAAYQNALSIKRDVPEVWANLGLMQHQVSDYAGAIASFTTAHQLQPKLFVPILFLGVDNLELGNRENALHYLLLAQQLHPDDPTLSMPLGRTYFGMKKFDDATAAYLRATELNLKNGEAWYRLGITYLKLAEEDSRTLSKQHRQSPFFRALEAESLGSQGHLKEAERAYHDLLAAQNSLPCIRSSLGFILAREGRLAEAETELQKDVRSGNCLLANLGLIRLSVEKGEIPSALSSLNALWQLDRGFVKTYISLVTTSIDTQRFEDLDKALTQSKLPNLSSEDIALVRASLHGGYTPPVDTSKPSRQATETTVAYPQVLEYYRRGEYRRCANSLMTGISTLSRNKLSILASCSFFTGDLNTTSAAGTQLRRTEASKDEGLYWLIRAKQGLAVRALVHAGEVEPDSIRLHELLAESYRDMGRYDAAENEYTLVLGMNPKDFSALIGAAANYLQEYRLDLAYEAIQRAIEQRPSDPEANYIAGEILIDQHKYDEAKPHLESSLTAKAELIPRIHGLLGQVYANQGDNERAIEEFKIGISSDDDGSLHYLLGRLYQKTGKKELADAAFKDSRRIANNR